MKKFNGSQLSYGPPLFNSIVLCLFFITLSQGFNIFPSFSYQLKSSSPDYINVIASTHKSSTVRRGIMPKDILRNSKTSTTSLLAIPASSTTTSSSFDASDATFPEGITDEWEIDCYSRPVVAEDGKKLWEVLVTDSSGKFRYVKSLASNVVNSRNLRRVVEDLADRSPVRPRVIRFFRNQMLNMITIALSQIDGLETKPSRRTHSLLNWLQERETTVYPKMSGFNPQLRQQTVLDYEVTQADRLPDVLRPEAYAFVALPAEVFWDGQVSSSNINRGSLCPLQDLPRTGWVHGITLISKRAESIAAWLSGLEIGSLRADLLSRELLMQCDITTQLIVATLNDKQRKEAQIFEKGKGAVAGYHFLSVQESADAEEVAGFWMLRQFDDVL